MGAVIIASYFLIPAFLLYYSTQFSIINKIGVVVFCYGIGLVMGNIQIIPDSISSLQGDVMGLTILLGIPLVLFSENVVKWAKMAKTTFISLLLGVVSVVVLVRTGFHRILYIQEHHPRNMEDLRDDDWCVYRGNAQPGGHCTCTVR